MTQLARHIMPSRESAWVMTGPIQPERNFIEQDGKETVQLPQPIAQQAVEGKAGGGSALLRLIPAMPDEEGRSGLQGRMGMEKGKKGGQARRSAAMVRAGWGVAISVLSLLD